MKKYTVELEEQNVRVSYYGEIGTPAYRAAKLILRAIEQAGDGARVLAGYSITVEAVVARSDEYAISVDGNEIVATAGGILGCECIKRYFEKLLAEGSAPRSVKGCVSKGYEDSNRFAFDLQGDHRVMFYNVLWDNGVMESAWERNIMTPYVVREFLPSVVGFQECGKRKRAECHVHDIALEMTKMGYVETPVEVKNEYHDVNCTPLFFDPELVEYLDGAYYWYRNQAVDVHRMDRSSKSLTWGLFKDKKSGEKYVVVSTHMCTQDDSIREVQAGEACELFATLHEKYGVPIILGGDFNSTVKQKGYLYFHETMGYPSALKEATVATCDTMTYHPYPALDFSLGMVMPTSGAILHAPERSVDHVLYPYMEKDFETRVYGVVVNDYTLATSDHFPIFVDFCIH